MSIAFAGKRFLLVKVRLCVLVDRRDAQYMDGILDPLEFELILAANHTRSALA